jgi:BlaR1 peptidase M56
MRSGTIRNCWPACGSWSTVDSAGRNFTALTGVAAALAGYGTCALLAWTGVPSALRGGLLNSDAGLISVLGIAGIAGLFGASLGRGTSSLARQARASRALSKWVTSVSMPAPPRLLSIAGEARLNGRVQVMQIEEACCFVHGIFVPRVAIGRALLTRLTGSELRAVLEHESYHVRHLDPLRRMLGRATVAACFPVPLLTLLLERFEAARELAADEFATRACRARDLAGAILKSVETSSWPDRSALTVPLASRDLLALRLSQLETGLRPRLPPADRRRALASLGGLLGAAGLLVMADLPRDGLMSLVHVIAPALSIVGVMNGAAVCIAPLLVIGQVALWLLRMQAAKPI